ncbi:MAG: penicillin acylase family protein [Actinomycetota bacterium]
MRWVKRILVFLLLVVLAGTVYGVFTVRNSFPQVDGELAIEGLVDNVEVLRDELGVPHIYASNEHDLFFAQGFTHAQDRFWQMDFWRHIGSGRLSEMFGDSQLETDIFLRSLGFQALAEEEWESLGSPSREVLQSYADGVNAYLDTYSGSGISLEYAILGLQNSGYEIEPWVPTDTLIWAKMMSWDLAGNFEAEIDRALLGKDLPPERVEQLYPTIGDDKPVIVESGQAATADGATVAIPEEEVVADLMAAGSIIDRVHELTGGGFEGIGSNNWVVGGELTESGLPLLANDTHLGIQMPSIWYENSLHCVETTPDCRFNVVGFSFPGSPGVVIGHNAHHAWGVTNLAADTSDLFIERVNPDDPRQYEVDGEWVDFEVRTETFEVAGGDEVTTEILSSRHGPLIDGTYIEGGAFAGSSTVDTPDQHAIALSWRTLEPSTIIDAFIGINMATSYDGFVEAAARWDIAPQNLVYADVEGNIAYHATGEIPVRAGGDGRYPVPGWTSEYDWVGTIPTEEMPRLLNPPQGFIVTANQPVLRPGSSPLIGTDAALGYRAARIQEMISATSSHDVQTMQDMQMDARDGGAETVIPYLLDADTSGDGAAAEMQELLEVWSTGDDAFQADGDSTGAAVYMAVWRHLLANLFHDELPEDQWPTGGSRWFEVVASLLTSPTDPYWDDISTPETETMDQILVEAMSDAHAELTELLGPETADWTWGDLHIARFENQSLGQSGIAPVEWLFNRTAPLRLGGSSSLVNAVGWDTDKSYLVDWVPSQRMVADLSDHDSSTFIHTTGQSGHAFHGNYDSMIEMWVDGEHGPMPWTRPAVEAVAVDTMTMVPTD